MTKLELYKNALIEQNKLEAPTLLLEEYNYLINKAIIQYVNLTYARFDLNQQSSDDLRWLQRSAKLKIDEQKNVIIPPMEQANYACSLPTDYFHVLNCTIHFKANGDSKESSKCKPQDDDGEGGIYSMCRRLTANQFPAIIQNAYLKPTYRRPYFYINTSNNESSSEVSSEEHLPKYIEIRCGKSNYTPDYAYVDYLKYPDVVTLDWDDIDGESDIDNSGECEFPDAVAYEIINIFVKLLFENASDPRLQTHFAVNQTVGEIPKVSK